MKNILIVFTGGTFSMKIDETTGAAVPFFHGNELLAKVPDSDLPANIKVFEYGNYPGPHMTPEIMLDLSKKIQIVEDIFSQQLE